MDGAHGARKSRLDPCDCGKWAEVGRAGAKGKGHNLVFAVAVAFAAVVVVVANAFAVVGDGEACIGDAAVAAS